MRISCRISVSIIIAVFGIALINISMYGQSSMVINPIESGANQFNTSDRSLNALLANDSRIDPVKLAQILDDTEHTFPNLSTELKKADLFKKISSDPSLRGNLRGRIAEADWIKRNASEGWLIVKKKNAPQNDAKRYLPKGKMEGAQVKVHNDPDEYIKSMRKDNKAEYFVLPDDHYEYVYENLEKRRVGALRGGLTEKAEEYSRQQKRLRKLGRSFKELDRSIDMAAKHYRRINTALRNAGKAAPYVGIALGILDGGIAVYDCVSGKDDVEGLVNILGKACVGGTASWWLSGVAVELIPAGASPLAPVAVLVVVGTVTYLVVDWAYDNAVSNLKAAKISAKDLALVWPHGQIGVPISHPKW